jgi:hypothetical protein
MLINNILRILISPSLTSDFNKLNRLHGNTKWKYKADQWKYLIYSLQFSFSFPEGIKTYVPYGGTHQGWRHRTYHTEGPTKGAGTNLHWTSDLSFEAIRHKSAKHNHVFFLLKHDYMFRIAQTVIRPLLQNFQNKPKYSPVLFTRPDGLCRPKHAAIPQMWLCLDEFMTDRIEGLPNAAGYLP